MIRSSSAAGVLSVFWFTGDNPHWPSTWILQDGGCTTAKAHPGCFEGQHHSRESLRIKCGISLSPLVLLAWHNYRDRMSWMNPQTNQSGLLGSTLAPRGKSHSWQRQHKACVGLVPPQDSTQEEEDEGLEGLNCVKGECLWYLWDIWKEKGFA